MLYAFRAAVVDGTFSNGCRFSGEPHGPAEEVYNCRCTLVSAIKGFEGDKVTYSPKLGDMSFEKWVGEHEKRLDKTGESGIIKNIELTTEEKEPCKCISSNPNSSSMHKTTKNFDDVKVINTDPKIVMQTDLLERVHSLIQGLTLMRFLGAKRLLNSSMKK